MKLTLELNEEQEQRVRKAAERLHVTPEDLLRAGVADFLGQPDENFRLASEQVLCKNRELYRRLA